MSEFETPYELFRAYEDGLAGWRFDMRANMEFLNAQKYQYFSEPNIKGVGLGKRALLWQYAKKLDANCFTERQTTGDCFVAGTLVRMGDGTEKRIEVIAPGDEVASPFGGVRKVLSTFEKPYSGAVCTLSAEGCMDSVTATEDHRFVSFASKSEFIWEAAGSLRDGDRVFVPRTAIAKDELHFYGESAVAVLPSRLKAPATRRASCVWRVAGGFAPRVKSNVRSQFTGTVYCIEVEEDHAFIANGYAVHNCVSHGSRNARDITRAVEILVKKEPEDWFKMGATEPTYGARGHGGEGMSPGRASQFERDVGFLARTNYEGVVDLSKYKSSIGSKWGAGGVPENVKALCRKNKVGLISQVRTQEDLMDAMFNGYAAHSGQYASWSVESNSKGVHGRTPGGWNHDMCVAGYDDSKEFFPFRVWMIANSWGAWNQKPKGWPKEYGEWVPGMILTSADDFNVCVESGDCWVYGSIDGYPPQKLPDYGTIGLLQHG